MPVATRRKEPTYQMPFTGATSTTVPYQIPGSVINDPIAAGAGPADIALAQASPEAQQIHAIVNGWISADQKRKMAEQLQLDHLVSLANEGGQSSNRKLAGIVAGLPTAQQTFDQRRATGDVSGMPISSPPVPQDSDLQAIMASMASGQLPGRRPVPGYGTGIGPGIPSGQTAGGALQAGGRSFGPDLGIMGAPATASPSDSGNDQRYRELLAMGGLREKGFTEHPSQPENMPGIGMGGKFFELPAKMRSSETSQDVIRRVNQDHPRQGFPRQSNPWVTNQAQQKSFQRQGVSSPLAAMLARTDDAGEMGQFAQAAIDPKGAAIRAGREMAAAKIKADSDRLNSLPGRLASIPANADAATVKSLSDRFLKEETRKGLGGGIPGEPERNIAGEALPPLEMSMQLDDLYETYEEDPSKFLLAVPLDVIRKNKDAFLAYFNKKFGGGGGADVLGNALDSNQSLWSTTEPDHLNAIADLFGYHRMSNPTIRPGAGSMNWGEWWRDIVN